MKQLWLVLAFLIAGASGLLPPARPAVAAPLAGPGGGWVKANVVGGGCDTQGHCSSEVTPGSPALYEYKPNRDPVARNEPPGGADHGGYPTFEKRDQCNYQGQILGWAAGIWHHGGYWTLIYGPNGEEQWSGPTRQHWAFEHNDDCLPEATATATNAPPPTATQPAGQPTWTPPPPTNTPTATQPPTPTEPAGPNCIKDGLTTSTRPQADYYTIWTPSIAGESLPSEPLRWYPNMIPSGQTPPTVPATVPTFDKAPLLDIRFDQTPAYGGPPPNNLSDGGANMGYWRWQDLRLFRAIQWDASSQMNWDYIGDMRWELAYVGGDHDDNGYDDNLRLAYEPMATLWSRPMPERFMMRGDEHPRNEPPIDFTSTLQDLAPGIYLIASRTHQDACNAHQRMVGFYFRVNDPRLPITPTTPPATAIPTVTPSPTATPTPLPPPPPVPNATFKVSIHSTLDPNSNDSDPDNAVYKSNGNQIAWPAGEVLDFTPRVQITLSPSAPAYPGYRFRAHVRDWSFVSSLGQNAATATDALGRRGCRGSGTTTNGAAGPVCTYDYIGGASLNDTTEPNEADMASQAHVYWAVGKPLSMRPDVYVYNLGNLQSVDLKVEVRIVVEVVNVATGQVVDSRTDTTTGTFGVALVVPRSAK